MERTTMGPSVQRERQSFHSTILSHIQILIDFIAPCIPRLPPVVCLRRPSPDLPHAYASFDLFQRPCSQCTTIGVRLCCVRTILCQLLGGDGDPAHGGVQSHGEYEHLFSVVAISIALPYPEVATEPDPRLIGIKALFFARAASVATLSFSTPIRLLGPVLVLAKFRLQPESSHADPTTLFLDRDPYQRPIRTPCVPHQANSADL